MAAGSGTAGRSTRDAFLRVEEELGMGFEPFLDAIPACLYGGTILFIVLIKNTCHCKHLKADENLSHLYELITIIGLAPR